MGATTCTHPLDTVKVQLQTQKKLEFGFFSMGRNIVQKTGFLSLYNGMTAALMRQATYSTARFAVYELTKEFILERNQKKDLTFGEKMLVAASGGAIGSFFGSPFDLINVRMQNDSKLEPNMRRNYKNSIDAFFRIIKYEGFTSLYVGFHVATLRGVIVTIGQLAVYDELKEKLLKTEKFEDNLKTHFLAGMGAGLVATLITMPVDVLKTILMNAKPGELSGLKQAIIVTSKFGIRGFFKGFWPRYIRLGPFTLLTFIFFEKLKVTYRALNKMCN
jgi:solute carrier family 25 (mitochondrial dicarboxylate transporter), member 10